MEVKKKQKEKKKTEKTKSTRSDALIIVYNPDRKVRNPDKKRKPGYLQTF